MSHVYHEGLPGYDERSIWHDGCPECEQRAAAGFPSVHELDHGNRLRAWRLMRATKWSGGEGADHDVSICDHRLANALYSVAVFLERCGIKPDEVEDRLAAENERLESRMREMFG